MNQARSENYCYEYLDSAPFAVIGGHRYWRVYRLVNNSRDEWMRDGQGVRAMVECEGVTKQALEAWRAQAAAARSSAVLRPDDIATSSDAMLAWITFFPLALDKFSAAVLPYTFRSLWTGVEMYLYGLAECEAAGGLKPAGVFIDEADHMAAVDTSPLSPGTEPSGLPLLRDMLKGQMGANAVLLLLNSQHTAQEIHADVCRHNKARKNAQSPDGGELRGVRVRLRAKKKTASFSMPYEIADGPRNPDIMIDQPVLTAAELAVSLRAVYLPEGTLPFERLFELILDERDNQLRLKNLSGLPWGRADDPHLSVEPGQCAVPRQGETFTVQITDKIVLEFTVDKFHTVESIAPAAPSIPAPPAPASIPAPSRPERPVPAAAPAKPLPRKKGIEELLSRFQLEDTPPEIGESAAGFEIAERHPVIVDHYPPDAWREARIAPVYRGLSQWTPVPGLGQLRYFCVDDRDQSLWIVRDEVNTKGLFEVGDPRIRSLSFEKKRVAAVNLAAILEGVMRQGWIPSQLLESRILIHPDTMDVTFPDGYLLCRPGEKMGARTLGYIAPESYRDGARATQAAVNYALAVWIFRLMTGGFPCEGGRTRQAVRGALLREAQLAEKLYGEEALFCFDAENAANRPDPDAPEAQAWERLPASCQAAFQAAFGGGLREPAQRPSPAQWIDALNNG